MAFQSSPEDVTAITAFHLLAGELERRCIGAYLSHRGWFSSLQTIMVEAAEAIDALAQAGLVGCSVGADCPQGYECNAGQCEVIMSSAAIARFGRARAKPRSSKPRSSKKRR
jgi:hypothetical protein